MSDADGDGKIGNCIRGYYPYNWAAVNGRLQQPNSHYDLRLLPPCAAGAIDWLEKRAFPANLFTRDHAFRVASARFTTPEAWLRGS